MKKIKMFVIITILPVMIMGQTNKIRLNKSDVGKLSVQEIIGKYIQACGGFELNKVMGESKKGTLVRGSSGKVPFDIISDSLGRWYYNQVFAYGDQVAYGFNGNGAWIQDTKKISGMSNRERLDLQMIIDCRLPQRLIEIYPEMKIKKSVSEDGVITIIIDAKTKDGIQNELAFDVSTGLLIRAGDIYFAEYGEKDKIKFPERIYIGDYTGPNSLRQCMEITEVKLNTVVDETIFNRPANLLPMRESLLYTLRKQVEVSPEAMEACTGKYQNIKDTIITYYITLQQNHLMIEFLGMRKTEIKPESELDYFIRASNWECHYIKDNSGKIAWLEIGADRNIKAKRIK
jgi:hypothetical protein